jgi:hypothetical protein
MPQCERDRMHRCFPNGLSQHGFMKADSRISIKDYRRSFFQANAIAAKPTQPHPNQSPWRL